MNPRVRLAVRFIKANLHHELTVDEISGVAGLKHSRLFELFQFEFRMAPLRYHRMLRLEKASGRLRNTLDKVEAIIVELGYDRRQFFRDFKARFGLTPSQYRSRHIWGQPDIERRKENNRNIRH